MKKIILLAILAASPVWATGNNNDPEAVAIAGAEADATAGATATSTIEINIDNAGEGGVDSQAAGPSLNSTQEGDTLTTSNESNFFALATTFPQVSGCFKGKQGGAAGSGTGIWFGGHGLDLNCFLTSIAESEPDIEVAARLKCGSKAFRNAISFEVKSGERQLHCVNYMTLKHRNELSALRERAEFLLTERNRIETELTERNKLLVQQCAEKLERSEEAWLECLAK